MPEPALQRDPLRLAAGRTRIPQGPMGDAQTIPGTGWNTLFRLYNPLEPWFDQTWRPGEIELVK